MIRRASRIAPVLLLAGACAAAAQTPPSALVVEVRWSGAAPDQVEREVVVPVEQALRGLEDLERIMSESRGGRCRIVVQHRPQRGVDDIRGDVVDRFRLSQPKLPDGAEVIVLPEGLDAWPACWVFARSERLAPAELGRWAEEVRRWLTMAVGVAEVRVIGATVPRVAIRIDPGRLVALNLDPAEVLRVLDDEAVSQLRGDPTHVSPLEELVIARREAAMIRLRDLAVVEVGLRRDGVAHHDGKEGAALAVYLRPGLGSADEISRRLAEVRERLPEGVELVAPFERAEGRSPGWRVEVESPGRRIDEWLPTISDRLRAAIQPAEVLAVHDGRTDDPHAATLFVHLRDGRADRAADLRAALADLPGLAARILAVPGRDRSAAVRWPINLALTGPDLGDLHQWAARLADRLRGDHRVTDAAARGVGMTDTQELVLDRDKLARLGVTPGQAGEVLRLARGIEVAASPVEVWAQVGDGGRDAWVELSVRAADGQRVSLREVVRHGRTHAPDAMYRVDGERAVFLTASPASKTAVDDARARCREVADRLRRDLPEAGRYRVVDLDAPVGAARPAPAPRPR